MERSLPCEKHTEQIKTLFKRVDDAKNKIDDMTDMKLTINTISLTMQNIQEHNERQDTWNRNILESQSKLNELQNNTLDRINENLNKLNTGQTNLEGQVTELKQRVDENEAKHNIDLRDIKNEKYRCIEEIRNSFWRWNSHRQLY